MKTGAGIRRTAQWLATIGIVFVVVACSGAAAERTSTPANGSTPTPASAPASSPTLGPGVTPLAAGPHTAQVLGSGTYPGFTVVVPAGWYDVGSHFVLKYHRPISPAPSWASASGT